MTRDFDFDMNDIAERENAAARAQEAAEAVGRGETPVDEDAGRLFEAFVQDSNLYEPMEMWVGERGALTVDIYDGEEPVGRVSVRVERGPDGRFVLRADVAAGPSPKPEHIAG